MVRRKWASQPAENTFQNSAAEGETEAVTGVRLHRHLQACNATLRSKKRRFSYSLSWMQRGQAETVGILIILA